MIVAHAETDMHALLDEALLRGSHISMWQHSEALAQEGVTDVWQNAVAYAAQAHQRGLWVAPLTEIVQHCAAIQKVGTQLIWRDNSMPLDPTQYLRPSYHPRADHTRQSNRIAEFARWCNHNH